MLGVQLLKWRSTASDLLLLEDEGRLIGRLHLPLPLQAAMKMAPLVVLEASFEARAARIHQDYILDNWGRFEEAYDDEAFTAFSNYLLQALGSIKKRLGGVGFETCQNKLTDALASVGSSTSWPTITIRCIPISLIRRLSASCSGVMPLRWADILLTLECDLAPNSAGLMPWPCSAGLIALFLS